MELETIIEKVYALGVIPVIKIENADDAEPLAKALCRGGLPAAEVTFRTAAAAQAIRRMHEAFPDMLICAGTVLTPGQADEAVAAGASFVVSPGLNPDVVRHCLEHTIPIIPGCATPSDMERAISFGLPVVKFFPAEAAGGLAAIKAMSAPYPQLRFMPTGGIHAGNLPDYLAFQKILCCGGSFMVPEALLKSGDFAHITSLTQDAVQAVHGFKVKSLPQAGETSSLTRLLRMEGHALQLQVRSLDRAKAYLHLIGIKTEAAGNMLTVTGETPYPIVISENGGGL